MNHPLVTIETRRQGTITLELYPDIAPQSVRNFIQLVRSGFFDGLPFWRVEKGRLIQTGMPANGDAFGAGYAIKGEFTENGFANPLRFQRGTIGYGRLLPDSANTHVFISLRDDPELDDKFGAFGRVVSAIEAVDAIADGPAEAMGAFVHRALDPEFIERMTVDTFGVEVPAPDKLPEPSREALMAEYERMAALPRTDESAAKA